MLPFLVNCKRARYKFEIKRYRLSKSINGLVLDLTSMTTTTVKRLLTNQMCAMHSTNQLTEKKTQVTKRTLIRKLDMSVQLQMKIQRHYCPLISKIIQLITTTRMKFTEKFDVFVFCDTSRSYFTDDSQCKCKRCYS